MCSSTMPVVAIVPAAGIGTRMNAGIAKQYLPINDNTVIGCALDALLTHSAISQVIVALHPNDNHFYHLPQANHPKLISVIGGEERVDSVLSALNIIPKNTWVLVHDAARPCLTHIDIDKLLAVRNTYPHGAILASPVRDTMKRADSEHNIINTVERKLLWHAMTPQMFQSDELKINIERAINASINITDDASAMEWAGYHPYLVQGRIDNIKVTHPEDLAVASMFLTAQKLIEPSN